MNKKEYLELLARDRSKSQDVTFIIANVVKNEHAPGYHYEYYQTPIRSISDWLYSKTLEEYLVINKDHCPIDINGSWLNKYNGGHLNCCIITKISDFYIMYNEEQANDMIEYYKKLIK